MRYSFFDIVLINIIRINRNAINTAPPGTTNGRLTTNANISQMISKAISATINKAISVELTSTFPFALRRDMHPHMV